MFCVRLLSTFRSLCFFWMRISLTAEAESSISINFSVQWDNSVAMKGLWVLFVCCVRLCGVLPGNVVVNLVH